MTANVDAMVREGIRAYREGNKSEARALLERAVEEDSYNEQAWLWLSAVVESKEEQGTCLENVLVINPNNERAKMGLRSLGIDPNAIINANAQQAIEGTLDDSLTDFEESDDVFSSDDDWSSESQTSSPQTEGSDNYDDWIANLGIDDSATQSGTSTSPAFSNTDFDDLIDDSDVLFGSSAASSPEPESTPRADDTDGLFDDDDDFAVFESSTSSGFDSGPFGTSLDIDDDETGPEQPAPAPKPAARIMSPGAENVDDNFNFLEGLDVPLSTEVEPDEPVEADPASYFAQIPEEIKTTRLPGTRQLYSIPVTIGTIVLILLNIYALIFMISNVL